jgi:sugar lactone lactonase YvrE
MLSVACSPSQPHHDQPSRLGEEAGSQAELLAHYERATEAANRGDWAEARDAFLSAIEIAPDAPVLHLHAARSAAHLGDEPSCRGHLETALGLGATADLPADEAFAGLLDSPGFGDLADRLLANGEPHPTAEVVHRFTDPEFWPEGIAADAETGDIYVGSIHRRSVNRITSDGRLEVVGSAAEDGLLEVIGIWVDAPRRALWAVTGDGEWRGSGDGPPRKNELVRFDLDTDQLDGRWPIPDDQLRLLNDVVVGPDGSAWATESLRGEVFRVTPAGELELFARYPELVFLNGIAISGDGGKLFLGHFAGVSVVSPVSGSIEPLRARGTAVGMVDGLSWAGESLVVVQNHPRVNFRVVRVDLAADGVTVERLEILPSGLPEGLIPYTSAVDGDLVLVVAAATFDLMDRGEVPPAPAVVRFPLEP